MWKYGRNVGNKKHGNDNSNMEEIREKGIRQIYLKFGSMADKIKIWQRYRYLEAGQIYVGLENH